MEHHRSAWPWVALCRGQRHNATQGHADRWCSIIAPNLLGCGHEDGAYAHSREATIDTSHEDILGDGKECSHKSVLVKDGHNNAVAFCAITHHEEHQLQNSLEHHSVGSRVHRELHPRLRQLVAI